ncbi:hypothetical protein AOQ71_31585 [Bradyrhizobium manausense]|uniref:Uncharacterized protein n=1 Tax=Bradyrhizobium manausense TaxID=989370 RepID=A0A0R3D0E8_9BRAD|nr:hypothetical protein AOQ71_31585 [Bradyrhizobium manausense]
MLAAARRQGLTVRGVAVAPKLKIIKEASCYRVVCHGETLRRCETRAEANRLTRELAMQISCKSVQ